MGATAMQHENSLGLTRDEPVIGCAYDRARQQDGALGQREPWCGLLADAAPRDHIVQLYQDQQFLNRAVCRFAAAAIANGEAVILVPTLAHWDAFRPHMEAEGVDVEAAQGTGQLTVVDADELLPRFMHEAMPDAPVFLGLAGDVIARGAGRAATRRCAGGVRWSTSFGSAGMWPPA